MKHKVHIILEGPGYARLVRERCAWLEERGIKHDWGAYDTGPLKNKWGIVFGFDNKNDAMRFRLVWA